MKNGFGRAEAYGETNGNLRKETERKLTEKLNESLQKKTERKLTEKLKLKLHIKNKTKTNIQ